MTAEELLNQLNEAGLNNPTDDEMDWLSDRLSKDDNDDNLLLYLGAIKAGKKLKEIDAQYKENNDFVDSIIDEHDRIKSRINNLNRTTSKLMGAMNIVASNVEPIINSTLGNIDPALGTAILNKASDSAVLTTINYNSTSEAIADKLGVSTSAGELLNPLTPIGSTKASKEITEAVRLLTRKYAKTIAKFKSLPTSQNTSIEIHEFPEEIQQQLISKAQNFDPDLMLHWLSYMSKIIGSKRDPQVVSQLIENGYNSFIINDPIRPQYFNAVAY